MPDLADTRRQADEILRQETWVGGVQDFILRDKIRPESANRLENVETHIHGTARRRGGLRQQRQNTASSSDVSYLLKAISTVRGIDPFLVAMYNTAPNTSALVIDKGLQGYQQVTIPPELSWDQNSDAFAILDRVYFTKSGRDPYYWDGTDALQQERATPGFPGTSIPPITTGVFFQGRAWAGGDPAKPDLVYFSSGLGTNGNGEAGRSPFTWDRDFQAFRMVTGRVSAIIPFRNQALIVFTDRGVESLEPNCCEILNTHRLTLNTNIGSPFRHTVQICGESIYFMDQEGHIRSLAQTELDENRGVTNAPLSMTINNVIERQTKNRLEWARAGFARGIYWIWMPTGGSQYANEGWGYSIRDESWIGPYYLERDNDADLLTSMFVGGVVGHRFTGDQERTYLIAKNRATAIKTFIAFDPLDLDDDGTLIPMTIETRAYDSPIEAEETWQHVQTEYRILHSPGDVDLTVTVRARVDEGGYTDVETLTVSTNAGPHLSVDLPFPLVPDSRQSFGSSFTSILPRGHNVQLQITTRDDTVTYEVLDLKVTSKTDNLNYELAGG